MEHILQLEDNEEFILALENYRKEYSQTKDFEIWKNYYFLLWYILAEDFPLGLQHFVVENKIWDELKIITQEGLKHFKNIPEALFVMGYTMNIFPFLFGDYTEWENHAEELLESLTNILPNDNIYKMVYLGSVSNGMEKEYIEICKIAAPEVKLRFSGKGLFNSYFNEVLYRIE